MAYKLDDYRCVFPVLAPLCITMKGENDYRIVIDYSTSINTYGRGKEQFYTDERFLTELEAIQYLEDKIYEQDEEHGSCQRHLQLIDERYYYLHNVYAKIYVDYALSDGYAFLDFGEIGGSGDYLLNDRSFDDEKELLEYLRKESKRWGSNVYVKRNDEKKEDCDKSKD